MKIAYFFVKCKKNPSHDYKSWVPHMSVIYSVCSCGEPTGYNQIDYKEHYDKFQIVLTKIKGESYEDEMARAIGPIKADPAKYLVDTFGDIGELIGKKHRIKPNKMSLSSVGRATDSKSGRS